MQVAAFTFVPEPVSNSTNPPFYTVDLTLDTLDLVYAFPDSGATVTGRGQRARQGAHPLSCCNPFQELLRVVAIGARSPR